jgi:hypothetical protein
LNDELRDVHLTVSASFPRESDVALSAEKHGTPLALAPKSQCAVSYRSVAGKVEEAVTQHSRANQGPRVRDGRQTDEARFVGFATPDRRTRERRIMKASAITTMENSRAT